MGILAVKCQHACVFFDDLHERFCKISKLSKLDTVTRLSATKGKVSPAPCPSVDVCLTCFNLIRAKEKGHVYFDVNT